MHNEFTAARKGCFLLILAFLLLNSLKAQVPTVVFQPVITNGLSSPVDIVNAGDGTNRIFIVQQGGIIKVYDQSLNYLADFLTVSGISCCDERGLLSLAFHPDYKNNRFFFVYYTNASGDIEVARYQTDISNPNLADPLSKVVLLTISHPTYGNHNGGKLNFGNDGKLYFGTGDGGSGDDPANNAQNGNSLLGKMIRIEVSTSLNPPYYTIPGDNPYVSDTAVLDEIWALGLRNPWRWSFDRENFDMWIADVGQNAWEEVDFRPAGSTGGINFGWRCYEGHVQNPNGIDLSKCGPSSSYVFPIFDYSHNDLIGGHSIIGGYVYRGSEYPTLRGYYIAGDYSSKNLWLIHPDGSFSMQTGFPQLLVSFGEAENGVMYASAGGAIYKVAVAAQAPVPVKLISFTLKQESNYNLLNWKTALEINLREFILEYSTDGIYFKEAGRLAASRITNGSTYSFRHDFRNEKKLYYRLKSVDDDERFEYSRIITTVAGNIADPLKIIHQPGSSSTLLELNRPFSWIKVYNVYGQLIHRQNLAGNTGMIYLNTSGWSKGTYTIIAGSIELSTSRKLIIQ